MFSVMFEVHPRPDRWDAYLGYAKALRPELEAVDGFVDNVRYRSLTREGWILSLSGWRDEKALVRWRTSARHHQVQQNGREDVFLDYHLRIGQVLEDTRLPAGQSLAEQRLDETQVGAGTAITLLDARRPAAWMQSASPAEVASSLGLDVASEGLVAWDAFDAVLTPGDALVLATWRDQDAAQTCARRHPASGGTRSRRIRVIRDYGMFDRREAPQYYPDVERR